MDSLGTFENGFPAPFTVPIPSDGIIHNPDKSQAYFYIPQGLQELVCDAVELRRSAGAAGYTS